MPKFKAEWIEGGGFYTVTCSDRRGEANIQVQSYVEVIDMLRGFDASIKLDEMYNHKKMDQEKKKDE